MFKASIPGEFKYNMRKALDQVLQFGYLLRRKAIYLFPAIIRKPTDGRFEPEIHGFFYNNLDRLCPVLHHTFGMDDFRLIR